MNPIHSRDKYSWNSNDFSGSALVWSRKKIWRISFSKRHPNSKLRVPNERKLRIILTQMHTALTEKAFVLFILMYIQVSKLWQQPFFFFFFLSPIQMCLPNDCTYTLGGIRPARGDALTKLHENASVFTCIYSLPVSHTERLMHERREIIYNSFGVHVASAHSRSARRRRKSCLAQRLLYGTFGTVIWRIDDKLCLCALRIIAETASTNVLRMSTFLFGWHFSDFRADYWVSLQLRSRQKWKFVNYCLWITFIAC